MTRQGSLFTQTRDAYRNVTTKPAIPLNSSVEEADKPRINGQAERILSRLREGPATNVELSAIALRYSARLGELKAAGFDWEITDRNRETGVNTYRLISEPQR
jgi:hypothetical protein